MKKKSSISQYNYTEIFIRDANFDEWGFHAIRTTKQRNGATEVQARSEIEGEKGLWKKGKVAVNNERRKFSLDPRAVKILGQAGAVVAKSTFEQTFHFIEKFSTPLMTGKCYKNHNKSATAKIRRNKVGTLLNSLVSKISDFR